MTDLPRVTYSNTGEDFSGVHAYLAERIPEVEQRLLGKSWPAIVGGRERTDGQVAIARSPIDRDIVLGEFPQAGEALVNAAIEAARAAYPAWRDIGWPRRAGNRCTGRTHCWLWAWMRGAAATLFARSSFSAPVLRSNSGSTTGWAPPSVWKRWRGGLARWDSTSGQPSCWARQKCCGT